MTKHQKIRRVSGTLFLALALVLAAQACGEGDSPAEPEALEEVEEKVQATATQAPTARPPPTATPASAGSATVIYDLVNLRAGPGTDFEVIGQVVLGDELPVYAQNEDGSWFVTDEGGQTWIASWLVEFDGDISTVPVAPAAP
jgi:uncharacterized protein YraI